MRRNRTFPRKHIFVFGSNEGGIHGAGAALTARNSYDMPLGKSYGHYGKAFAIPTKDEYFQVLSLQTIRAYVGGFIAYARAHKRQNFLVTAIGTGLSGLSHMDMANMFSDAPDNCYFDEVWRPYLGDLFKYWGTYED